MGSRRAAIVGCCVLSILLLSVLSNKTLGKGSGMIVSTNEWYECSLPPTPSLTLSFTSTAGRSDPVKRRPGLFRKKVSPLTLMEQSIIGIPLTYHDSYSHELRSLPAARLHINFDIDASAPQDIRMSWHIQRLSCKLLILAFFVPSPTIKDLRRCSICSCFQALADV